MKINKLTASFGKLENESLSFHPGLNVIYAPNESGKSTWCAFIRAMLYGIDSSERVRAGYLPDKLRYAPWSGAPMEGSMDLTTGRADITISRTTRAKSAPMREFSACYTGSSVPVDGMTGAKVLHRNCCVDGVTGANAGEMLTGVSRDVFCRSAFIAQGSVAVTGSPELEKRISSIVSTGEEQTSYSEADERLRAWQRKRRFNRRGYLPELEAKMDDTQRMLNSMDESAAEIAALEDRLAESGARCAALESAVTESRKLQRRESLDKLSRGRAELKAAEETHDKALAALSDAKDALRAGPFGAVSADEAEASAADDLAALDELKARGRRRVSPLLAIMFFVLAVAGAALYTHFQSVAYICLAAAFCIAAVVLFMRYSKARRAALDARAERRKILDGYGVRSASDIRAALDGHRALCRAVDTAERQELDTRRAYDEARDRQAMLEEAALGELDFSGGSSEAARLSRELAAERQNAERISSKISALNGRLAAVGDPLVLTSDLRTMEDEYNGLCEEYDAISLAVDTLRAADSELQSRFSPQLGKLAAQYMSFMTGGRYSDVLINRDFSASAKTQDDAVARDSEYLSAGTLDLMYLAVRLAVCELAMPAGETGPLIIDDALVNLDEERLRQAMALLRELARSRQIILFTCRDVNVK